MKKTLSILGIVLIAAGVITYSGLFTVHQTQQALVLQFGSPVRLVREPGLNFKIPFVQNVEYFDRRILDLDPPVQEGILFDQKRINVDAFARYRIVDPLEFRKRAVTDLNFRQVFGNRLNAAIRDLANRLGGRWCFFPGQKHTVKIRQGRVPFFTPCSLQRPPLKLVDCHPATQSTR